MRCASSSLQGVEKIQAAATTEYLPAMPEVCDAVKKSRIRSDEWDEGWD
jgi:hypothetical protein